MEDKSNTVVEAYVSQMFLRPGQSPGWGDLLLRINLTSMLKWTPVLSIPAWRWMPESLSNPAYCATSQGLFKQPRPQLPQVDLIPLQPPVFTRRWRQGSYVQRELCAQRRTR